MTGESKRLITDFADKSIIGKNVRVEMGNGSATIIHTGEIWAIGGGAVITKYYIVVNSGHGRIFVFQDIKHPDCIVTQFDESIEARVFLED